MPPLPSFYQTRELDLDIEGLPIRLSLVNNLDDLLDELMAKGDDHEDVQDERLPYWAELWPSAIALGRYLVTQKIIQPGMKVLELGCGLGLSGIVAGKLGASITLSDYLEEALVFARHNWSLNLEEPGNFVQMDWRDPDPTLAADLVLAADLAYEKYAFESLPNAFRTLCRPGGAILISEPNRPIAQPFLESLPQQGFHLEKTALSGIYEKLPYQVTIYRLTIPPA